MEYETRGYCHVPRVFSEYELKGLRDEFKRVAKKQGCNRPWGGAWKDTSSHADPNVEYSLIVVPHIHRESEYWREMCESHPKLIETVTELLGGTPRFDQSMGVSKPPETGQPFPVHQDSAYYGQNRERYCIVTVHLDTTTHENGALRFLPGLHAKAIPHSKAGAGKWYLPTGEYRIEDTVEVCAEAGDVVCFSHHTPHASYPNRSKEPRTLVRLGYVLA